jgi:hypothetical protein
MCPENRDDLSVILKDFAPDVKVVEELLTQGKCIFLLGAGCSKCAGLPLMGELTDKVLERDCLSNDSKSILEGIRSNFENGIAPNIEDYLSELIDHLSIADRRFEKGIKDPSATIGEKKYSKEQLRKAVEEIKEGISKCIKRPTNNANTSVHRAFVKAVHKQNRPGRPTQLSNITYLVLNYDTLLEDALALEKIPFCDGIEGGSSGWWNPSKFTLPGIHSNVLKLHGSIDWLQIENDPLPRRCAPGIIPDTEEKTILIWPASTKYTQAQLDPYAQLLNQARLELEAKKQSEKVLFTCGYSFADAHINAEIDRALRVSEGNLTVVALTSDNEPLGQLKQWHDDKGISDQIRIYANKGVFHGSDTQRSESDLLWWKFENFVRLLRGEA